MKRNKIFTLLMLASLVLVYTSCEKDKTPDAPLLPPQEAFAMDFSDFNDEKYADGKKAMSVEGSLMSYTHYAHAFLTVAGWNTMATLTIAVPVISYAAVLNTEPVYLGDNKWEWTSSVEAEPATYTARLTAERISNEEFKAEMYITKEAVMGFENFKWFEGTVRYDRTHASWTLYESPANPIELLNIEWNKDWEKEVSDISYTNVKEGGTELGSYIMFEIVDETPYNARYTISHTQNTVLIEWNRETKAGRISDPGKFGDDAWYCWDDSFQDVVCE